MCAFRVLQLLESGLAEYGVTLRRLEKHYRVCLSADVSGRKDAAAATLLHSQVRPTAVQGMLACGVNNASQSPPPPVNTWTAATGRRGTGRPRKGS